MLRLDTCCFLHHYTSNSTFSVTKSDIKLRVIIKIHLLLVVAIISLPLVFTTVQKETRLAHPLMTRSRRWVWTHLTPQSAGSRGAVCNFCGIVYKGGKTNRVLVHLARACNNIPAEVNRGALSRLPVTEVLCNSAAALENVCGEPNTSSVINRGVFGGGPSFFIP